MALKKYCVIALLVIMAMLLPLGSPIVVALESPPESSPGLHTGWMTEDYTSGTYNRTYEYYIPTGYDGSEAVPLLFSFHGLGSSGVDQIDLTKFDALAEREGFIAVFPDATDLTGYSCNETLPPLEGAEIQWNLGAGSLQYCAGIDDVGFVADMVDWFGDNYNIDASRIYSTGMSDGALFSYLLAFNLTDTFAGIAPVCGPMPWGFGNPTTTPITVILMHGTADPILYYNGYGGLGGNVTYSVDETIAYWCGVDNTTTGPVETVWGPTISDNTKVTRYVYGGGTNGTEVILFKVDGGGHTWPSGPLYSLWVGAVTNHIDGSALIWKHLPPEKYYLKISSTDDGSVTAPGERTFFYDADISPTEVTLEASPKSSNYEFTGWTGDVDTIDDPDAATTTITVQPNTDYEITANFQLIEEEEPPGGCFIATAAYGTSTAEQLDVLREFRDVVLLESAVGSRLVDLYYQVSPPIADFISESSFVRTLVR
ncbi:MAG TPA: CFI-box-CTERM domain-containing protein, partial [Dehalococcoidia bacterium]|nr:CFI-box-CTERM domain-containing protein [Dehalococcoidia bacterium]